MPSTLSVRFVLEPRIATTTLPKNEFGFLVGTFDHSTLVPEGKTKPDNNHIYLWIRVPSGTLAGEFECAFNIHSATGAGTAAEVLFTERRQDLTGTPLPTPGFSAANVNFADLGLVDADFAPVVQGKLQSLVSQLSQTCDIIGVYGTTYSDGTGLHDVHMNSGTGGKGDRQGQDGALVFYFQGNGEGTPQPYAQWVFTKFANQHITPAPAS